MSAKRPLFRRFRLIYRHSSTLVKCVVLAAIVLSTAALMILRVSIQTQQNQQQELQGQAAQLEKDNRILTQYIAELGTVKSVKRIATQELGLVDPDSQFFTPGSTQQNH